MYGLAGPLIDDVRARLAASSAFRTMMPPAGMEGRGVPHLRLTSPDERVIRCGALNQLEIDLAFSVVAPVRLEAYRIGRAAMAAISPRKYRVRNGRSIAALILRWRSDHLAQEADEGGLWHYAQVFVAQGLAA